MIRTLTALALIAATPLAAQDWAHRAGDVAFAAEALDARLRGRVLTFFDDGQSHYFEDGRYTYTYANQGGTAYGYWRVDAGSVVCIEFVHGAARCDRLVLNGARLILLTEGGDRFPVRPE